MFNRTVMIAPARSITEYRYVTEKRAPIDESVKLLREMEGAARAEVIKAVAVENNAFNCVFHHARDPASDRVMLKAVFMLNGHKMTAEVSAPRDTNVGETFVALRDEIARVIATEMLASIQIPARLF